MSSSTASNKQTNLWLFVEDENVLALTALDGQGLLHCSDLKAAARDFVISYTKIQLAHFCSRFSQMNVAETGETGKAHCGQQEANCRLFCGAENEHGSLKNDCDVIWIIDKRMTLFVVFHRSTNRVSLSCELIRVIM